MGLEEEASALEDAGNTRDALVAAADLFRRAEAAGDLGVALSAKAHEITVARRLGAIQHVVVACSELLELDAERLAMFAHETQLRRVKSRLVWSLKRGTGCAMALPEIPFSTVRELLATLGRVLGTLGVQPVVLWTLEAHLAHMEGDEATLQDRVARFAPQLSFTSCLEEFGDCPGCGLLDVADFLGSDAPAEAVEEALAPALENRTMPRDVPRWHVLKRHFGDSLMCDNAKKSIPVRLARAYVRAGRLAEARVQAARALALAEGEPAEYRVRAAVAALETAIATNDEAAANIHVAAIARDIDDVESPYRQFRTTLAQYKGLRMLGRGDELGPVAERATALARRLDQRPASPTHEESARKTILG
jgi:hypothetical protein